MSCIVKNLTCRTISLHCNSGDTLHLPSAYVLEISEQELIGNALVEKLKSGKLISVTDKPARAAKSINKKSAGSSAKRKSTQADK